MSQDSSDNESENAVAESENAVAIQPESAADANVFNLACLPVEMRAKVLAWLAFMSVSSFVRAVRSCREFSEIAQSALVWEPICQAIYSDASTKVLQYKSWSSMFKRRPHMRFNGVFVAKCQYVRAGEPLPGAWYPAWIQVSYWRYLRFAPDGRVRLLLCNDDPQTVLTVAGSARSIAKETEGFWSLDEDRGVITIDAPGAISAMEYTLELQVASSGGKLHNKLKWNKYSYRKIDATQEGDFPLEHEGSFYFVRLSRGGL